MSRPRVSTLTRSVKPSSLRGLCYADTSCVDRIDVLTRYGAVAQDSVAWQAVGWPHAFRLTCPVSSWRPLSQHTWPVESDASLSFDSPGANNTGTETNLNLIDSQAELKLKLNWTTL
jgi:hypothetical protein